MTRDSFEASDIGPEIVQEIADLRRFTERLIAGEALPDPAFCSSQRSVVPGFLRDWGEVERTAAALPWALPDSGPIKVTREQNSVSESGNPFYAILLTTLIRHEACQALALMGRPVWEDQLLLYHLEEHRTESVDLHLAASIEAALRRACGLRSALPRAPSTKTVQQVYGLYMSDRREPFHLPPGPLTALMADLKGHTGEHSFVALAQSFWRIWHDRSVFGQDCQILARLLAPALMHWVTGHTPVLFLSEACRTHKARLVSLTSPDDQIALFLKMALTTLQNARQFYDALVQDWSLLEARLGPTRSTSRVRQAALFAYARPLFRAQDVRAAMGLSAKGADLMIEALLDHGHITIFSRRARGRILKCQAGFMKS